MFEPAYEENDARRAIDLYSAELAAMAEAAITQYPDFDPPGAVICEPGTSEGDSLRTQLDPRVPLRIVDDGVALLVLKQAQLRNAVGTLQPEMLSFLDDPAFVGEGRLPVLAVCKEGFLMGSVGR